MKNRESLCFLCDAGVEGESDVGLVHCNKDTQRTRFLEPTGIDPAGHDGMWEASVTQTMRNSNVYNHFTHADYKRIARAHATMTLHITQEHGIMWKRSNREAFCEFNG